MREYHVRRVMVYVVLLLVAVGVGGCHDLTGSPGLPAGTPDPSSYNTAAGAREIRNAAVFQFEQMLSLYATDAGLLTDELTDFQTGASTGVLLGNGGQVTDPLDERILPEGTTGGTADYGNLQGTRAMLNQAIGALATYDTVAADTGSAKVLRGELYALEGYAEILLADLFCSGVPLSTLDFQKDFTYHASSTTDQVYQDAVAKFDTALSLAGSNDTILNLARVGRGRVLLDRGQYAAAAQAVTAVPDAFVYQELGAVWGLYTPYVTGSMFLQATESDHEGSVGLPFLSSGDPRTVDTITTFFYPNAQINYEIGVPKKYAVALNDGGTAPITLASGVEARLIQAEALHANANDGTWLTMLNALRTDGTFSVVGADTMWHAGTGGVSGLPPLAMPTSSTAQVDLLFTERAYWLYLTGTRQGDLRRLIRQYGRLENQVYPTGSYLAPGTGRYGTDITVPIPTAEYANPLFHGCLDRKA